MKKLIVLMFLILFFGGCSAEWWGDPAEWSGGSWTMIIWVLIFLGCFLIVPIMKIFEEKLENEEEKENWLLNHINDDYMKNELELAGLLDITLKYEAVVNRPTKKKGNWKVYMCWELPYHSGGRQQRLQYEISDEKLSSILKNANNQVMEDSKTAPPLKTKIEEVDKPAMTNDEALDKLKKAKEKLDLELITQEEYDKTKEELKQYIS
tara:strand:+ start:252 stop:875 length:624 start_codon:yes stop_codon:yes gene_type:complete